MLSVAVRSKRFEAIAGRDAKITEHPRLIQKTKFSQSDILNVCRQFSATAAGPDQFRFRIGEPLNHDQL